MGARERLVLVQVGSTQLLLGVAPGRISLLHQLDEPVEATGSRANNGVERLLTGSFSDKLAAALSRSK
jgi:flagellar protein FliO/FliZ